VALAQGDLSAILLSRRDVTAAVESARAGVELFEHVEGFRDVRMGPVLWNRYARTLLAAGDPASAGQWAQRAVDADVKYDDPASADLAAARATLAEARRSHP
jgi:hypothetical protein